MNGPASIQFIDDQDFIKAKELDYFGQVTPNPKTSLSEFPFGRIFLNDSMYEG